MYFNVCILVSIPQISANTQNTAPYAPTALLTNELEQPLNTEDVTFSWLVNDADENEIQTAYEIIVTDEITNKDIWDSGKIASSEQSYVSYSGETLENAHPYSWKVKIWDKDDAAPSLTRYKRFIIHVTPRTKII